MDTLLKNENAVIIYPALCCSSMYAFSLLTADRFKAESISLLEFQKYNLLTSYFLWF